MKLLTAEEIGAVWKEAALTYGLDPATNDKQAGEALFRQPLDMKNLPATLAAMEIVREKTPEFFETHDYDWAFGPTVWQKSLEANYQSRIFQHLSMVYRSPYRDPAWRFGEVVVRYAFQTDVLSTSPFHLEHKGLHFITVPFAFNETLLLLLGAFLDKLGGIDSTWAILDDNPTKPDPGQISPYLKHLLLRMLTTDRYHPSMPGESPIEIIKRNVAWFADATEVPGELGPLMDHMTMSLIDYALAHELGHRLLGHSGVTLLADTDTRVAAEIDADRVGFHLFTTSWGWRDELLDGSPLSPLARIMLGPLCFSMFERLYTAVLAGFATSCSSADMDPGFNVDTLGSRRREAEARMHATFKLIQLHQQQSIAKGADFAEADKKVLERLINRLIQFEHDCLNQASTIPQAAVRTAREIVKPLF